MENETKIGMNRTGMQMAPIEGPDQVEYAMSQPATPGSPQEMQALRAEYIRQASRIGSVPVPGTGRGLMETAMGKLKGNSPELLIDKLGQRLAYERTGVRLYQALITKVETVGHTHLDEMRGDLNRICTEEAEHFHMLTQVMLDMGADPTAQTPCADVSGVASLGLLQVITDPRTTISQSLEAILTVELTDNACWELLIELVSETGHETLVTPFSDALKAEQQHMLIIKKWLRASVMAEAT